MIYLGKLIIKFHTSRYVEVEAEDKFKAIKLLEEEKDSRETLEEIYLRLN